MIHYIVMACYYHGTSTALIDCLEDKTLAEELKDELNALVKDRKNQTSRTRLTNLFEEWKGKHGFLLETILHDEYEVHEVIVAQCSK